MRKYGSITLLQRLSSVKSLYVVCTTPGVKSRLYRDQDLDLRRFCLRDTVRLPVFPNARLWCYPQRAVLFAVSGGRTPQPRITYVQNSYGVQSLQISVLGASSWPVANSITSSVVEVKNDWSDTSTLPRNFFVCIGVGLP